MISFLPVRNSSIKIYFLTGCIARHKLRYGRTLQILRERSHENLDFLKIRRRLYDGRFLLEPLIFRLAIRIVLYITMLV